MHNAATAQPTSCIDLTAYADRYRIRYEEQRSEWPRTEHGWLARIACKGGFIGVQGGARLTAFTTRRGIGRMLRALPFVEQAQGHIETRVVFHVDHLNEVLAILKPYRRRQLTPEQAAAGAARLAAYRAAKESA